MEIFGVLALILVLASSQLPRKLNRLNKRVLKLEKIKTEVSMMSEVLKGLIGERCYFIMDGGLTKIVGTVLIVDEDWMKLNIVGKNNTESIVVKRIEDIKQISVLSK